MTTNIDALAVAVGVLVPVEVNPPEVEHPEVEAARERYNKAGERLTAISFGLVVGTGLMWCAMLDLL